MKKMFKNKKGFTLIELMIVVAIIGILAAIAIPNFMNYQCKAKQSEAKSTLGSLRTAQEAYYAEYSTYADNTAKMGFEVKGDTIYTIGIDSGTKTGFVATAEAKLRSDSVDDKWKVTEDGKVVNNGANACTD